MALPRGAQISAIQLGVRDLRAAISRLSAGRRCGLYVGGLADDRACVLRAGRPIPGLYAAGEITGPFYATAPNAVAILRAFVFGRIAGREAVGHLQTVYAP
jgi:predicted oxidoreductase